MHGIRSSRPTGVDVDDSNGARGRRASAIRRQRRVEERSPVRSQDQFESSDRRVVANEIRRHLLPEGDLRKAERLFAQVRTLAESGVGIIYISHRIDEVVNLCHRVTVLRDGQTVGD